ncbi:hypothetical protein [Cardinium endosymbiont of Nabis limbatus]|uniref:hypothetical protein n=1 Tax=Cardinium endosymbiont of Nabis limbatus TaxID=3066217 RepID=UPI003AF3F608
MKIQIPIPKLGFVFLMLMLNALKCTSQDKNKDLTSQSPSKGRTGDDSNKQSFPTTDPPQNNSFSSNSKDAATETEEKGETETTDLTQEENQNQNDKDQSKNEALKDTNDKGAANNEVNSDTKSSSSDAETERETENNEKISQDNNLKQSNGSQPTSLAAPVNKNLSNVVNPGRTRSSSFTFAAKNSPIPGSSLASKSVTDLRSKTLNNNKTSNQNLNNQPVNTPPNTNQNSNPTTESKDIKQASDIPTSSVLNKKETNNAQSSIRSVENLPGNNSNIDRSEDKVYNKDTASCRERLAHGTKKYGGFGKFIKSKIRKKKH